MQDMTRLPDYVTRVCVGPYLSPSLPLLLVSGHGMYDY